MAAKSGQINIRSDQELDERIARLLPLVSAERGVRMTTSDLIRFALIRLEQLYVWGSPRPVDAPRPGSTPKKRKK